MADQKVIGVDQEARRYSIGIFRLILIPLTELNVARADQVLNVLKSIGDLKEDTLIDALVKVYGSLLRPTLRFDGWQRPFRFIGLTPLFILRRFANVNQVGEIIRDFTVLNFGSTQPSKSSSGSFLLSFLRDQPLQPLTTSSTV